MLKGNATYEVGYGKPPKETRFVAGKSGNPNGRPKGSKNLASVVLQESRTIVRVSGPNGTQEITKLQAAVRQLANKSAQGDLRATRELLVLVQRSEESVESKAVSTDLNESDTKVMEGILKRMKRIQVDSSNGSSTGAKLNDPLLLTPDEYRAIVRRDFASFIERSFHELNPSEEFIYGEYVGLLASAFEKVRAGEIKRLIINLPPRTLKSHVASVAFPAFLLGHDPTKKIICASYGQDLSDKHARDCRTLMDSQFYRKLFPNTAISAQRRSINDFATTVNGTRLSTSVGGVLTGRGADVIILDDPLKPDDALSETRRKAANDWYFNTVLSRLNSKENGAIIIVMQRLHQQDLVGEVMEREPWTILSLPAIAVDDESYPYETVFGPRIFTRQSETALHPERDSVETYKRIRDTIGEYNYQSQYQQDPNPLEGGLIKREWVRYYMPEDRPEYFEYVLQSWDTASKAGETNDYSVCTTWGISNGKFYLLDIVRQKLTFPQLKRAVAETFRKYYVSKVLIEDKASGIALLQELQSEGVYCVEAYKAESGKDKYMRLAAQSIKFENGRVYVPNDAPWLKEYLREITGFPGARHDDQVDSTSQALEFLGPMAPHPTDRTFTGFSWARETC